MFQMRGGGGPTPRPPPPRIPQYTIPYDSIETRVGGGGVIHVHNHNQTPFVMHISFLSKLIMR